MTNWIKTSDKQPTEKGLYLVVYDISGYYIYDTCKWTPNLHEVAEYDFPENEYNRSGFYEYNNEWGEWGYYEIKALAWQPIEDYIEE